MLPAFFRKHWPWVAAIAAAAAYYPRFIHPGGLLLYRHAAECVWSQQILQVCDQAFTYPPAFAVVMLPFVALPMGLAVLLWYLVTLGCTALCLILCKRLALQAIPGDWQGRDLRAFEIISFIISLKFILAVYEDPGLRPAGAAVHAVRHLGAGDPPRCRGRRFAGRRRGAESDAADLPALSAVQAPLHGGRRLHRGAAGALRRYPTSRSRRKAARMAI